MVDYSSIWLHEILQRSLESSLCHEHLMTSYSVLSLLRSRKCSLEAAVIQLYNQVSIQSDLLVTEMTVGWRVDKPWWSESLECVSQFVLQLVVCRYTAYHNHGQQKQHGWWMFWFYRCAPNWIFRSHHWARKNSSYIKMWFVSIHIIKCL